MKVVLPDNSELELPDGATGLDAARAIGPKLAEQAVLIRANGSVQDLRLPLQDGQPIQILTTRDKDDADALSVLRHSSAHLLAEAVRRLYPGVKIAIGPPIENGFYYDFEFPEPIHEEDLETIEAEIQRELKEGREWTREEISRDEAKARFATEHEPYKVELVDTAEGDITLYMQSHDGVAEFTDLCRGPHLQNAKPIKALKLTGLAGAYWRGDSSKQQLTRIYGTAFYTQEDLAAHLERLEEARRRDHRRLGVQLDLFHLSEHSPGSPFWHPKGMVIWNELEDLRRRENLRRGYKEVKTPLLYDVETLTSPRATTRTTRRTSSSSRRRRSRTSSFALKPMNCPGHMLLFGSALRSYRDLPLRYAESSTLHRDELAGTLHGLLRVRHITQDDAHIFCTEDQIQGEIHGMVEYARYLYDLFGLEPRAELSTRPEKRLGTDEQWDRAEGALEEALKHHGMDYVISPGEGTFYGPKIDLHMTDSLGRSWQMGTIQLDYQMPIRFGLTYYGRRQPGAPPGGDPPRPARLARAVHGHPHRALRRRLPVLARPRPGAGAAGRRAPSRARGGRGRAPARGRLPGRRGGADGDDRQADPQRRAGEDPVHHRLRRPRVGRVAGRPRPRRRAVHPRDFGSAGPACYASVLKSRGGPVPHLPGHGARAGFNRVEFDEDRAAA